MAWNIMGTLHDGVSVGVITGTVIHDNRVATGNAIQGQRTRRAVALPLAQQTGVMRAPLWPVTLWQ